MPLPELSGHGLFALALSYGSLSLPVGTCIFIGKRQKSLEAMAEAEIDPQATNIRAGLAATASTFLVQLTAEQIHLKIVASEDEYHGFVTTVHKDERHDWVDLGSWETKRFASREMTGTILDLYAHAVYSKDQ
ncbi:hypothetical protein CDV31_016521 [Fusarium ambrosium]|uniref:Uncharacterized protein n=1 Tax=Fusarium ambrosium TaxID=131363 RepID=A0A428S873_9HYPO|nr:hypothetical protein CDV31_016521 [Fusarium ambrosium]